MVETTPCTILRSMALDMPAKERQQTVVDEYVADLMATYDFDGLLAMHDRTFRP